MTIYRNGDREFDSEGAGATALLAAIHASHQRPLCMCRGKGVAMYVAKIPSGFVVKRMPNTGAFHDPSCESYEPPAALSGLGEVMGTAIKENPDDGTTALKFDFALSKSPGKAPPVGDGKEKDSVKADGKKLTMRGTLHYLWEQAGFHRWIPQFEGKRSWGVVRRHLLQAAGGKQAKGNALEDSLFIPEPFVLAEKDAINNRRQARVARLSVATKGARPLMLMIGEVKEFAPARYGQKLVVKHMGDYPIMLADDIHKRMLKRFGNELQSWEAVEGAKLIFIGTFGVSAAGYPSFEELALMTVTDQWIPFESYHEQQLVERLTTSRRSFVKGLRYNLGSDRPLASAVLSDVQPDPVSLYIIPPAPETSYAVALADLVKESHLPAWFWDTSAGGLPALPATSGYSSMPMPELAVAESGTAPSDEPGAQPGPSEPAAASTANGEDLFISDDEAARYADLIGDRSHEE